MKVQEALSGDEEDVREYLAELIEALDNLDEQDYFGSAGWRRYLLGDF